MAPLFSKEDGPGGMRFNVFIAILWSIWGGRNAKNLRQQQIDSTHTKSRYIDNLQEHNIFLARTTKELPRQLTKEEQLGFLVANIGKCLHANPDIFIHRDGGWDRKSKLGCVAWVAMSPLSINGRGQAFVDMLLHRFNLKQELA